MNYRSQILKELIPHFRENEKLYLLVGDMGFGAIDDLKNEFPTRVINAGVMEQGMVGIAAGMAMSGLKPVVFTIINFLCFRAIEQIRNDIILQDLPVKLIGTGAEDYFSFLGPSHTCGQDDIKIMDIVGCEVFDPYGMHFSFENMVEDWITSSDAGYIRV